MIWSSNWIALCNLSNWVNKGFIKCFCYFSWILCRYHLNCLLALLGFFICSQSIFFLLDQASLKLLIKTYTVAFILFLIWFQKHIKLIFIFSTSQPCSLLFVCIQSPQILTIYFCVLFFRNTHFYLFRQPAIYSSLSCCAALLHFSGSLLGNPKRFSGLWKDPQKDQTEIWSISFLKNLLFPEMVWVTH